jgi:cell division protein ZapA
MEERLSIRIKIADRDYAFKSLPEEEVFLRDAGKLIRERIEVHRSRGVRDTQDILALVALDCLVSSLKTDDQARQMQNRIYDRIAQLNQTITPSLA